MDSRNPPCQTGTPSGEDFDRSAESHPGDRGPEAPGIIGSILRYRKLATISVAFALLVLAGCQRAPSYSILGSFFPVWLFCIILGVVLSFLLHLLLLRLQLNEQLAPPLLVYPSLAILFSLVLWLVFFS